MSKFVTNTAKLGSIFKEVIKKRLIIFFLPNDIHTFVVLLANTEFVLLGVVYFTQAKTLNSYKIVFEAIANIIYRRLNGYIMNIVNNKSKNVTRQ